MGNKTIAAALSLTLLSACATEQQGVKIVTQAVPTPVPCAEASEVPVEPPLVADQLNGNAVHDLGVIAPNAVLLRKWGRELYAILVPGCTTLSD